MSYPQRAYTSNEKKELLARLASSRSAREKKRLFCLKLRVVDGKPAREIAALTGYAPSTVEDMISTYHTGGLEPFLYKKRTGNHRKLTPDQERQLLQPFWEAAQDGRGPSVEEVRRAYEKKAGSKMTLRNTYYMLHRNNWPFFRTWSKQNKKARTTYSTSRQAGLFLRDVQ